jgi:N-acetylglucosamine-6-phosphate deacetylase
MIALAGADLVLPDRVLPAGTLVIDAGRIAAIHETPPRDLTVLNLDGCTLVPGFVDVHVHGVLGVDTLDPGDAVARIATALPRYGVTAFCPTTVACGPEPLQRMLAQVRACRATPAAGAARVLPAHLESNFINPAYAGAQPASCLRAFASAADGTSDSPRARVATDADAAFSTADLLRVLDAFAADIGIVTMAPECAGGLDLIAWLVARGIRVSLGHSGATYEQARAAIAAGARQATHLFNRMPPLHHRHPGLAGAALASDDVMVEVICDLVHVHPALIRTVVAAKTPTRVMAITDGTAASGLPSGSTARLGGQRITATSSHACLDDQTMAGSVLCMDEAFRRLTRQMGFSVVDAAAMCATTPARAMDLSGRGALEVGAHADVVLLDPSGAVSQTWIDGRLVYERRGVEGNSHRMPAV